MICSVCEGKNRDGARFCTYCGAPLALRCAVCDTTLVVGARFCDACGSAVREGDEPAAAARKVVTVLFGDLTGSTSMEERLDAEAVRSIIDRFSATMRAEIERYGGRVVKFTGDGVMAAFGVPEVREDDAARAIEAAIAMRTECQELASDLNVALALKVGINTGEVVVSEGDDDVVGDAVNVAARLEGAASAGEVFVGEQTWRLTRSAARFESLEPLTLKGKAEPVAAYRLLALDERTADSAAAPFVGRDSELHVLLDAFDEAVEASAARVVTIIGSPGLGKTRLARELTARLGDIAQVREARCDPAGTATFAPIADALREAAGITDADTGKDIVAKLVARLPDSDPERDRVAARAAAILGVGAPGTTEETFWAIRRLIEAAASDRPVVLVLDDLHWAEPLLLDLVEHLAEWIRTAPVLLVGTGRPELRDTRPSLAEGGRASAVIALEGLDGEATAKLALNLLGAVELPDELLARIPDSTHGNPLFVRELVRMLVDDGVLLRTGDGWRVTVDVDAIQVPPTIQSLLSARVDRLRNDERTVLELASVVGKEFYRGALHDLAPAAVRDLVDGCLESLRRKELVEPAGTYWIDEPVYRFHHVLIRDAAYRRVLKETRAELHERVAAWLEDKTTGVLGEHDELVGYHVEQAFEYRRQLGRSDDALGRRAAALLGGAARRALDRDDLPAAAALSGRALACVGDDAEERAELLLVLCEALLSMGDVARGSTAIDELQSLTSTPRLQAWATCFAAQLCTLRSTDDLEDVGQRVAAAAEELIGLGDPAGAAKAHIVRANILGSTGRIGEGEMVLDEALTFARQAGDRRRITETLGAAPSFALWGPSPVSRAGGRCLDIIRLLRITTGSPAVEAASMRCQALLEAFRGRAEASRRMLAGVRRTLAELGIRHHSTDLVAGTVESIAGDPSAALPYLSAAYESSRSAGLDVLAAHSAAELARAYLRLGDEDEADRFVDESSRLGGRDLTASIAWRSIKAELAARRGRHDEAQRLAREAVALAEPTDYLFDHGRACRSLAAVLRAGGDAAGAREADERAFALFERKGATAMLERAYTPTSIATTATGQRRSLDNACVRRTREFHALVVRGDAKGALAYYSGEVVLEDRRRIVGGTTIGSVARANLEQVASVLDEIDVDVMATRGERLALMPMVWRVSGYEVDTLLLAEIDGDGLFVQVIQFDPDDCDGAIAELDERFIGSEECEAPEVAGAVARLVRAVSASEWDELRFVMAPDAVVIDHRPASLGNLDGRDAWMSSLMQLQQLMPFHARIVAYHALHPDGCVVEILNDGDAAGAPQEITFYAVVGVRDNRVVRWEYFPIDDLPQASARLDALHHAPETHVLDTPCVRAMQIWARSYELEDWEQLSKLHRHDFVLVDRRVGLGFEQVGREAHIDQLRVMVGVGARTTAFIPLAVRGDRLVLGRWVLGDRNSDSIFQTHALIVNEIDDEGRHVGAVVFGPEDLDAAFAELDDRFARGEGAPFEDVVRLNARNIGSINDRDWESYASTLTDDFEMVDHRPASLGHFGMTELIDAQRHLGEVVPQLEVRLVAYHALAPDRCVSELSVMGHTVDGDALDLSLVSLLELKKGMAKRTEFFPISGIRDALERFAKLESERGAPPLENAATRFIRRMQEVLVRQDLTAFLALHSDSFVRDDRRVGIRHAHGLDDIRAYVEAASASGLGRFELLETLAIRGDRLALTLRRYSRDDFESEQLIIDEVDEDGRVGRATVFDPSDDDVAFIELDERFAAGEGKPYEQQLKLGAAVFRAMNDRDWVSYRSLLDDDLVLVDHRPTSLGEMSGAGAQVEAVQTLTSVMPNIRFRPVALYAMDERAAVVHVSALDRTSEGGVNELAFLAVYGLTPTAVSRIELFPPDALNDARARFEALTSPRFVFENRSSGVHREILRRTLARDREGVRRMSNEASAIFDRRLGLHGEVHGADEVLRFTDTMIDIGIREVEGEVVALRGERLSLMRWLYRGDFEVEALALMEVDDDGRALATWLYDADDLDTAIEELEKLFVSGEGAYAARVLDSVDRQVRAINGRDWLSLRATFGDDFEFVDHRPVSLGRLDLEGFLSSQRALVESANDFRVRVVDVDVLTADAVLYRGVASGALSDGGTFEITVLHLLFVRDGRIQRLEVFPVDGLETARSRIKGAPRWTRPVEHGV